MNHNSVELAKAKRANFQITFKYLHVEMSYLS